MNNYGNYNPLAGFTYKQLQYIYNQAPANSILRSNVASQLGAMQQSMQDRLMRERRQESPKESVK